MMTEHPRSGMNRGTATEALQHMKRRWEIKGAFLKMFKIQYFTSNN